MAMAGLYASRKLILDISMMSGHSDGHPILFGYLLLETLIRRKRAYCLRLLVGYSKPLSTYLKADVVNRQELVCKLPVLYREASGGPGRRRT